MSTLAKLPKFQPLDAEGNPYPGYKLWSYAAGTSTLKVTYKDKAETPNTNPVILNAGGMADVWLQGAYKLILAAPSANPLTDPTWSVDHIEEYNQLDWTGLIATITQLNATDTSTKTLNSNYDVLLTDRGKTLLCNTTSTAFYIQLTEAVISKNGYIISIKKINISSNAITIKPYTGQTIDGLSQLLITNKGEAVTLICDGSNWNILQDSTKIKIQPIITNSTLGNLTGIIPFPPRYFYRVQPSTVDIPILLPTLANIGDGFEITFKKVGTSTFSGIITPYGTEKIDDYNIPVSLHAAGESITLLSTVNGWYKIGDSVGEGGSGSLGSFLLLGYDSGDMPPAYLVADGRAISRTDYSAYFALVGTDYGAGNGTTTFNIPKAADAVIAGVMGTYTEYSVTSLTRIDYTATVQTSVNHAFTVGQWIKIEGATQTDYNGFWEVASTPAVNKFTYTLPTDIATTPATGTIKASGYPTSKFYFGQSLGELKHQLTVAELAEHHHSYTTYDDFWKQTGGDTPCWHNTDSASTGDKGDDVPHNNVQPTIVGRILIKVK